MKKNILEILIMGAFILFGVCFQAQASAIYYIADGVLPGNRTSIDNERTNFRNGASSAGILLNMEGFESNVSGTPIIYSDFTVSGPSFSTISGNNLITTEGNSVLDFITTGSTFTTFTFNNDINAFGIDITSIDMSNTYITFSDSLGNVLGSFNAPGTYAGVTFFGVINDVAFNNIRFDYTGNEYLNFDQLDYGTNPVPEPATMFLLGTGLVGVAGATRRKRKNQA